jgi:phenylalanyl-tRNA synthetase beta chain
VRISLEWLSDFVELPASVDDLCERLASAGVEVEEVINPAARVRGVVVAEVRKVEPHPDAERLNLCEVFDGEGTYKIVCGAPNVAEGMRVALARIGATLPGFTIERRAIRGVESEGMLCSRSELGLEEKSAGLWDLPISFGLGRDVLAEAQVPVVLDLGITPNRPDLLSHLGIGREVAAFTGKRTKPFKWRVTEKGPEVGALARVLVEEAPSCKRYVARVVRNLKVGPSPKWLKERLESIGQRSINNVVDATNYVLHELGQPLHAFDLSRLAVEAGCPTVRVRRAQAGEKLRTLDGVERALTPDDLVIADANRPVALAGVMGGADSEVSETTVSVLLESAYFEPVRVRQTARRHGLRTEASQRFERGVDLGMVIKAVDRCAQILAEIAEGEVAKGLLESSQKAEPVREIPLRLERVGRILGVSMATEAVVQLLEPLEIRCTGRTEAALIFQIPSFRSDITREIDIIEEIARRHGYERIPEHLPDTSAEYRYEAPTSRPSDTARRALLAGGYTEAVTYGFGSPARYAPYAAREGEPLRLLNGLGEELSALRTSLVPGLLQVLAHNARHGAKHVRLFEVGTTFHRREPGADEDERDRGLPREDSRVGLVLFGGRHAGRWYEHGETVDYSDLAGAVEGLVKAFALAEPLSARPTPVDGFNPFCSAELFVGERRVGTAGQVDPEAARGWDLPGAVFVAEVSLTALAAAPRRSVMHRSLPKFPGTRRDLAVVAERSLPAETLRSWIADHPGGSLGAAVVVRVVHFDIKFCKPIKPSH